MTEILIVEDERILLREYTDLFCDAGYFPRRARNAKEALAAFDEHVPDVVLLDVMMPGGDGFSLCEALRRRDALVPIVFNTALAGIDDMRRGLDLGGDDYVLKTDPPEELLARVARAVSRHRAFLDFRTAHKVIALGSITIDFAALEIREEGQASRRLTRTEADILRFLDAHHGEVVSLDALLEAVRGEGFATTEQTLRVHLANIRQKLGAARPRLETIRAQGYRLS